MQSSFIRFEVDVVIIPGVEVAVATLVGFVRINQFGRFVLYFVSPDFAEGASCSLSWINGSFLFFVRHLGHKRTLTVVVIFRDEGSEAIRRVGNRLLQAP